MTDTHSDAFKASIEAGDVVLEFGRVAKARVAVSQRIVLPLETARRLHVSLGEALAPHAAALRAAAAQALPPEHAASAVRPAAPVPRAAPDAAGERAALLLKLVGELGVPFQHERSFRVAEGALHANRFLLTVDRRGISGDVPSRVLDICRRLAMPEAAQAQALERFAAASCMHFGFEGDAGRVVVKLYLERTVSPEEARRAKARGEPALLHVAFKWEPDSGAHVVTEYLLHPALSAGEIGARLAGHVYPGADEGSLAIACAVLELAASRVAAEKLQYLEVHEPGNGRRSFDLNLYNAKLVVKDVQPQLQAMRERYGVRPGQFQALYDQIKGKVLGHLAGGVHRDGRDFFNVYYGVGSFPQFHEAFRRTP